MSNPHVPVERHLFRYDLANSFVATVRCRDGYPLDCHLSTGDALSLVLEPSLVLLQDNDGPNKASQTWIGLDRVVSVEFNRGARQEIRWVRDPSGFWIRLTDMGR